MTKNLMVLGTGSTVGKSIVCTALCRIFNNKGVNVAPFKSQNMALNSFTTEEGKEMGRAQVVQAEAARLAPSVLMNPILLKPESDRKSQVIVHGEVFKKLEAIDYYGFKETLLKESVSAYNELASRHDLIIMEGAGSPAEINLRKNDIVNMGMAEAVDAPAILVGDIDKGGVFAQILGTYMLLSEAEQKRVKGYVINKFRGDVKLLEPGIDMFYEKLPVPCLGVIPYADLEIDDEDSVTERFDRRATGDIRIAVIRLPYMSNFTDFSVLESEQDVEVRYVGKRENLEGYDLIVVPGSKNTVSDRIFMKQTKLDQAVKAAHAKGIPVLGICGGYQLLGKSIADPHFSESTVEEIDGLGILDVSTEMAEEKKTVQTKGVLMEMPAGWEGAPNVEGYEIHMGMTRLGEGVRPWIRLADGCEDGAINKEGNVFGTYIHGFFDHPDIRDAFLGPIRRKKGLEDGRSKTAWELKDAAYEALAELVEEHLDMDKLTEIVGVAQ